MGQTFIKKKLGVDIHGIYYIVEIANQIWWSFFLENIPFLTRMTQIWTKNITRKMKMTKNILNILKNLSMVMYIEKKS